MKLDLYDGLRCTQLTGIFFIILFFIGVALSIVGTITNPVNYDVKNDFFTIETFGNILIEIILIGVIPLIVFMLIFAILIHKHR